MPHVYNNDTVLQKLEQAIQDLGELQGDGAPQRQKMIEFLRGAVNECREFGQAYDQRLTRELSRV